jgi:soluble lytic murein transglycosylase
MQLMPGTAEEVSEELGLGYDRARLTGDWEYNARLGTAYLAGLQEMFGNSPVMIAAGYNAGPGRPRTWMTQRGDPRTGGVDVIDWIEHIPFTETRTYVMRVTEAIPAYRARLSGEAGSIAFTALLNGALPFIRPQARPDAAALAEARAVEAEADAPAPTLRPVARPEG